MSMTLKCAARLSHGLLCKQYGTDPATAQNQYYRVVGITKTMGGAPFKVLQLEAVKRPLNK